MMKQLVRVTVLIAQLTFLSSCGVDQGPLKFREKVVNTSDIQDGGHQLIKLQKELLIPRCSSCHNWVSSEEGIKSRINFGNPLKGPLYLRIEDGSMPLFGESFNEEELARVAEVLQEI
jgi:predicted small lipoprotein YifL